MRILPRSTAARPAWRFFFAVFTAFLALGTGPLVAGAEADAAPTNAVTVGADGQPFVDPVFVYKTLRGRGNVPDSYGVTITGGHVYRGQAFPALVGKYIFADWSRSMAIADGTLLVATRPMAGSAPERWTAQPLALKDFPDGRIKAFIWALGEDDDGELYVLTNGANLVTGARGKVFKLVPQ